ncbi:MAG TPA: DUF2796 domain-containing protein [Vibrio sp.]|nr:DUF2796 domain-containing protein [Vibrio sp.]
MRFMNILAPTALILASLSPIAYAHEHQHAHSLAAHQHGVATVNIALDEQQLILELQSPSMNIVGFEYHPRSAIDKQAVVDAEHALKNEQQLFTMSNAAQCILTAVHVDNDLAEHSDTHQQSAQDEDEHQHSDIQVSYQFNCAHPEKLKRIDLEGFFKTFPLTEKIHVQLISADSQQGVDLSQSHTAVSW